MGRDFFLGYIDFSRAQSERGVKFGIYIKQKT